MHQLFVSSIFVKQQIVRYASYSLAQFLWSSDWLAISQRNQRNERIAYRPIFHLLPNCGCRPLSHWPSWSIAALGQPDCCGDQGERWFVCKQVHSPYPYSTPTGPLSLSLNTSKIFGKRELLTEPINQIRSRSKLFNWSEASCPGRPRLPMKSQKCFGPPPPK